MPKFAQMSHCDIKGRYPILLILLDYCTRYTIRPVKPLNIDYGVFDTDILAKMYDYWYFGPKFDQRSF